MKANKVGAVSFKAGLDLLLGVTKGPSVGYKLWILADAGACLCLLCFQPLSSL